MNSTIQVNVMTEKLTFKEKIKDHFNYSSPLKDTHVGSRIAFVLIRLFTKKIINLAFSCYLKTPSQVLSILLVY